jgi:tRNA threonylcarbamoyladenosine biosynthesis protein TsaE
MSAKKTYISHSPEETFSLGQELGQSLRGGEILALYGDLGAGKTALVQGIAAGLGIKATVNSPTFTIMKLYPVKKGQIKRLCHIDAYRLSQGKELLEIGAGDYLGAVDTVSAVEWAEKVETLAESECMHIYLKALSATDREIIII